MGMQAQFAAYFGTAPRRKSMAKKQQYRNRVLVSAGFLAIPSARFFWKWATRWGLGIASDDPRPIVITLGISSVTHRRRRFWNVY
jgi:hypothetical protein